MTDIASNSPPEGGKRPKWPLFLGLFLAIAGGAGGFFAVRSDLFATGESAAGAASAGVEALPQIAFVPVDPIVVSLPEGRVLRFRAQLEVSQAHLADVQAMIPRVVDVMNGYLRALEPADFEEPAIMPKLRGHLLRRIQVVVGDGRVRDILIMEFVLS